MHNTLELQILTKFGKARRGALFFVSNFLTFANAKSVSK